MKLPAVGSVDEPPPTKVALGLPGPLDEMAADESVPEAELEEATKLEVAEDEDEVVDSARLLVPLTATLLLESVPALVCELEAPAPVSELEAPALVAELVAPVLVSELMLVETAADELSFMPVMSPTMLVTPPMMPIIPVDGLAEDEVELASSVDELVAAVKRRASMSTGESYRARH